MLGSCAGEREGGAYIPGFTTGPLISLPDTLLPARMLPLPFILPFVLPGTAGTGREGDGGGREKGSRPLLLLLLLRVGVMGLGVCLAPVRPFPAAPLKFKFSRGISGTNPICELGLGPSDIDRLVPMLSGLAEASAWANISMAALRLCCGGERDVFARLRGGVVAVFCRLSLLLFPFALPLLPFPLEEEPDCWEVGESGGDAGSDPASVA